MSVASALRQFAEAGDEDLSRLLLRAFRSVNAQVVARMVDLGHTSVRASHAAVFSNLDSQGSRIVTLAERAGMSRQGIRVLVRELEDAGYLAARPDPSDGRATQIVLTPRGERFCREAAVVVRELEAQWDRLLGGEGQGGLRHLRASLRALTGPAAPGNGGALPG